MLRMLIHICGPRIIALIALLLSITTTGNAQEARWSGGMFRPRLNVSVGYDRFTAFDQAAASIGLFPPEQERLQFRHAALLEVTAAIREQGNESDVRWRGVLLELNLVRDYRGYIWFPCGSMPLDGSYAPLALRSLAWGATLLDYDQTTAHDLDFLWGEARLGGHLSTIEGHGADASIGAGGASLRPGEESFPSLGERSDVLYKGIQLRARARVEGSLLFSGRNSLFFGGVVVRPSLDGSFRTIPGELDSRIVTAGAQIAALGSFGCDAPGWIAHLRAERIWIDIDESHGRTDHLQVGVSVLIDRSGE